MKRIALIFAVLTVAVCTAWPADAQWIPSNATSGPIYYNGGNVGIGTTTPGLLGFTPTLTLSGAGLAMIETQRTTQSSSGDIGLFDFWNGIKPPSGTGHRVGEFEVAPDGSDDAGRFIFWTRPHGADTEVTARMTIDSNGNVGIGVGALGVPVAKLDVRGDVNVTGTITGATVIGAVYQDVAEWVPASERLTPGTVVVLDRGHENQVCPSSTAYDTHVAGVVSATPGLLLGVGDESKAKVATVGRVRMKVDARESGIEIGDLLVTSSERGTAMKSEPIEMNGVRIHRPGTIVGKALQGLDAGTGEILVLLTLQ